MPWIDHIFLLQRAEFLERLPHLLSVAARQIRAANAQMEKRVAGKQEIFRQIACTARGVPRRMQNFNLHTCQLQPLSTRQQLIRRFSGKRLLGNHAQILLTVLRHVRICLMQIYWRTRRLSQGIYPRNMIKMPMGQQNRRQLHLLLLQIAQHCLRVIRGIDGNRLLALLLEE